MAYTVRNTGTRLRFDADDNMWHAKVRMVKVGGDGMEFDEFITQVATILELITWLMAILDGYAAQADVTVQGL